MMGRTRLEMILAKSTWKFHQQNTGFHSKNPWVFSSFFSFVLSVGPKIHTCLSLLALAAVPPRGFQVHLWLHHDPVLGQSPGGAAGAHLSRGPHQHEGARSSRSSSTWGCVTWDISIGYEMKYHWPSWYDRVQILLNMLYLPSNWWSTMIDFGWKNGVPSRKECPQMGCEISWAVNSWGCHFSDLHIWG